MDEIAKNKKAIILRELQKNARTSLSELAKTTGLSRQTVAKTINDMEKKKQIWGYTAIFDPRLLGKEPFMFMAKLDLSIDTEDFLKKVTNPELIKAHEEKYGFRTSMFLHGTSDVMILIWTKDIIEAKKLMNNYKKMFAENIKEIELLDVITTFRDNGIPNPNMLDEWKNILI
jgi:DNA-binding Lrp family transcriptional regulator